VSPSLFRPLPAPRRLRRARTLALVALPLLLAGLESSLPATPGWAGAATARHSAGGVVPAGHPRAALLPFENLAGREDQGTLFGRIFFAHLMASGAFEMIDPARVDEAMDVLALRSSGSLTPEQMRALGDTLHVPYLLLGSVLESGKFQSGGMDLPSEGATLRLVEAATGRVVWAGVHFRSGEDHESLFGWGRVRSAEKLISTMAGEMLGDFREAGERNRRAENGGRP
jgi:TolB-like protein